MPETYVNNSLIYDKVCGVVYLIKGTHPDAELEWVWENALSSLMERRDIRVMCKALIVRIRLPWNEVEWEWWWTEAELAENREDYDVIDMSMKGYDSENPDKGEHILDRAEYEADTERFEVTERRYLVSWKNTKEYVERMFGVRKEDTTVYISE